MQRTVKQRKFCKECGLPFDGKVNDKFCEQHRRLQSRRYLKRRSTFVKGGRFGRTTIKKRRKSDGKSS